MDAAELAGLLGAGEMAVVPPRTAAPLWPRVWSLAEQGGEISDGTHVWWLASQGGAEELAAPAPSELADEALAEWLKFFARD